ncbi:MAG: trehalose-phosphatase [Candidatus Thermoplasmatota archaeon]|nr:trehalose-phosphatase [Candidatus Thermoplasmatota archaeon]
MQKSECNGCPLASKAVYGYGNERAPVMLIGEAPGERESELGMPFVGKAGKELDGLLERAGLKRESIYITNVVKCRPPGNRKPKKEEILRCMPFLKEEIERVRPRLIALLGSTAVETFLGKLSVEQYHGTFVGRFFISYHPSMAFYGKREVMAKDFEKLSMAEKALRSEKRLVLLDYDGTLVPITSNPKDAVLSDEGKKILKALAERDHVVIVTGRSLRSIRSVFDLDMPIVANHGFEYYKVKEPEGFGRFERYRETAKRLYEYFKDMKTKGALVEDKTFGIALHYRNADENEFFEEFRRMIDGLDLDNMHIEYGKKVVELRPNEEWNKGQVVRYLTGLYEGLPIYIGDDNSDELAFEAIGEKGITIAVGKRETKARYMFRDEREVLSFLSILSEEEK